MKAKEYLAYVSDVIHTTVVATVDDEGLPVTAAIDMMDSDEDGLYFLTARGKSFYDRLTKRGYLALTALKGEDTMHSVAVSVRGKVRELGPEPLSRLFEKNLYMAEIYPTETSRAALTVFKIYEGTGEWFDLSKKPIERAEFSFGGAQTKLDGCFYVSRNSFASPGDLCNCNCCRYCGVEAAGIGLPVRFIYRRNHDSHAWRSRCLWC